MADTPNVKTYRSTLSVRAYEIDSFGHVNHAVYFNYLETARWEMLALEGITIQKFKEWKRWPVIAEARICYLRPVYMGDVLEIVTRIPEHGRTHFHIEQSILRHEERGALSVAQTRLHSVTVDERGRPAAMPEEFHLLWGAPT